MTPRYTKMLKSSIQIGTFLGRSKIRGNSPLVSGDGSFQFHPFNSNWLQCSISLGPALEFTLPMPKLSCSSLVSYSCLRSVLQVKLRHCLTHQPLHRKSSFMLFPSCDILMV